MRTFGKAVEVVQCTARFSVHCSLYRTDCFEFDRLGKGIHTVCRASPSQSIHLERTVEAPSEQRPASTPGRQHTVVTNYKVKERCHRVCTGYTL